MAKIGGVQLKRTRAVFAPTEAALHERIRETFPQIQRAWNDRDVDALARVATDAYVERARPVLEKLDRALQVNRIDDVDLRDVAIPAVRKGAEAKEMDAYLAFALRDWLEDLRTAKVIKGNPESLLAFVEHWSFRFDDSRGWLLDRVGNVWEGRSADGGVALRSLPAGPYSRPQAPARWVTWNGSAWTD